MNWKIILFWLFIFSGLTFSFFSYASFLFDAQEEMQLFILQWSVIKLQLSTPGGTCRILGLLCTQFYCFPLIASIINSCLLTSIGIGCYLLFQRITKRGYHLFLSLIPVFILLKAHIQSNYVIDGTIGILCLLLVLLGVLSFHSWKIRLAANIAGILFIFWTCGPLVLLYAILSIAFELIPFNSTIQTDSVSVRLFSGIVSFLLASLFIFIGIRYSLQTPLTEGLNGKAYHEMQLQSESFVYHIWIIFCTALLFLLLISWLLCFIKWQRKSVIIILTTSIITSFFLFVWFSLPNTYDAKNRMMDQLSYLSRRQKWDVIIQIHSGQKLSNTINRNYLNMALAQKGELGNRLFYFDQHGPNSLLTFYNGSYYMSVLLSDIHFMIGDISLSESYAMEGLTLARRGGSPRMLQRLIQISLIKQEWKLAQKYISILKQTLTYKEWAIRHEDFIAHPENMNEDPELKNKYFFPQENDALFSLLNIDTIWNKHFDEKSPNRTAFEYLGCSYLLAKETELFKQFLLKTVNHPIAKPLPLHFQEAALIAFADNPEVLQTISIDPSVIQKYNGYIRLANQMANQPNGIANIYKHYGNTYWFYHQYKNTGK